MITFVLGGGGTKGAAQAGAMRALLERGIVPDMLVGTSAGAINACHIAARPTPEGVAQLEDVWRSLTRDVLFSNTRPSAAWRTVRGESSLYSNQRLRRFLIARAPDITTFGKLPLPLYVVATDLRSGKPHVFGDDPDEPVLDAVMASTAFPPVYPPVRHGDSWLVDGGVSSSLPLNVAIQRGATEIYALDNFTPQPESLPDHLPVWTVTDLSLRSMLAQQVRDELAMARLQAGVLVYYIPVPFESDDSIWDVEPIGKYVDLGYATTHTYLRRRNLPHGEQSPARFIAKAAGRVRRAANRAALGVKTISRPLWRGRGKTEAIEDLSAGADDTDFDSVGE